MTFLLIFLFLFWINPRWKIVSAKEEGLIPFSITNNKIIAARNKFSQQLIIDFQYKSNLKTVIILKLQFSSKYHVNNLAIQSS